MKVSGAAGKVGMRLTVTDMLAVSRWLFVARQLCLLLVLLARSWLKIPDWRGVFMSCVQYRVRVVDEPVSVAR